MRARDESAPLRVAITGRRGRGKSTLAAALVELEPSLHRLAFADDLKREVHALTWAAENDTQNWPYFSDFDSAARLEKDLWGPAYQWWGEYRRRKTDPDYWVTRVAAKLNNGQPAVIDDYRHFNEAEWCRANGFLLVCVSGPARTSDPRDDDHPSERDIDRLPVDVAYRNDQGLDALRAFAATLLEEHR